MESMQLVGIANAARILNYSPTTLRRRVADGTIRPLGYVDGQQVVFDKAAIVELAKADLDDARRRLDAELAS